MVLFDRQKHNWFVIMDNKKHYIQLWNGITYLGPLRKSLLEAHVIMFYAWFIRSYKNHTTHSFTYRGYHYKMSSNHGKSMA